MAADRPEARRGEHHLSMCVSSEASPNSSAQVCVYFLQVGEGVY